MTLKKNFNIILLLLLCINHANSQNLYAEYGVTIYPEKSFLDKDATLKSYYLNAIENAKKLRLGLICTEDSSKFFNVSNLSDLQSMKGTDLLFAGYRGIVYDLKTELLSQSSLLGDNIYVKKELVNDWTLVNEQKEINGYVCYKATTLLIIEYGEKIFKHPVIAWFCPKIPYDFGPNGYSNLPGLILELQVRNVVYGVKKIELNTDKTFTIAKDDMKILSELEFEKALDKFNDF